ncbi:MAG: FimV/HubP family polar landmark protein [Ghiorsea sp.]
MFQRIMHVFLGFVCITLLSVSNVWAVTFGKMDVGSHMAEPFYAEVPLHLDADEKLIKTSVEVGGVADYRILEVYRDAAMNKIRVDIIDDERGSRVALSSEAAIDTAFFSVVLKVRYGRSTHYKKIPVFLEIRQAGSIDKRPKSPQVERIPAITSASVVPETSNAFVAKAPEDLMNPLEGTKEVLEEILVEAEVKAPEPKVFDAYDGWARSARYGPMVYGDTITTVAMRLRLGDKFTNQQVMVALYEKNRAQFSNDNINLIKAGTYLDVPSAQEVAQISKAQAVSVLSGQRKSWKSMVKKPQYAAVAEAQRTRYSSRVRIGQQATGTASAPMPTPLAAPVLSKKLKKAEAVKKKLQIKVDKVNEAKLAKAQADALQAKAGFAKSLAHKDSQLTTLQQKIASMEQRMALAEKVASQPVAQQVVATPESAVLEAQNKRLEIAVARMRKQLEQAKAEVGQDQSASDWMLYAVAGLGGLVVLLLVGIAMLMRKERSHPAEQADDQHLMGDELDDGYADAAGDSSIEDLDAQTFDEDDVATKVMNVDDFEMPSDVTSTDATASADNLDMLDAPLDMPNEEMPELTDDDTKEIEAFNTDGEEADPNVNYLEEADVYLRYGMEDEAIKQLHLALKLKPDDALVHAKIVQIHRTKDDAVSESRALAAAKSVLAGAALLEFEGALAGDLPAPDAADDDLKGSDSNDFVSTADDVEPVSFSPMDVVGEDTGAVDFGDFSLEADQADDDTDLEDTGNVNFENLDMADSEAGEASDGIDFGNIDFGGLPDAGDESNVTKDVEAGSEVTFGEGAVDGDLDFDFSSMGLDDETSSNDTEGGMVSDESIAFEGLNFENLDDSAVDEPVKVATGMEESIDLASLDMDFGDLAMPGMDSSDGLLGDDVTTESSLGADAEVATGMEDSIGLDSLGMDFGNLDMPGMDSSDGLLSDDVTVESSLGADAEVATGVEDSIGLDSLDMDFGDLVIPDMDSSDDLLADDVSETPTAIVNDAAVSLEDEGLDSLDIDFGDLAMPGMDVNDESAETPIAESVVDMENSLDIDFAELGLPNITDDFDMDSTAAIAVGDETMVVSTEHADLLVQDAIRNDREIDAARRLEEEDRNAVAVSIDTEADDPFAAANMSLLHEAEDDLASDLTGDDFGSLLGEDLDDLSLNDAPIDGGSSLLEDLPEPDADLTTAADELMASLEMDVGELDKAMDVQGIDPVLNASDVDISLENISGELVPSVEIDMEELGDALPDSALILEDLDAGELIESMNIELGDDLAYSDPVSDTDEMDTELEDQVLSSLVLDMDMINQTADIDVDSVLIEEIARKEAAKLAAVAQPSIDMQVSDPDLMSSLESDMSALESYQDQGSGVEDSLEDMGPAREDDLGLDDFDMGDLNLSDLDASEDLDSDTGLQSAMDNPNPEDDLDATVILHNLTEDLKNVLGDPSAETKDPLAIDENSTGLLAQAMDHVSDPVGENFSAAGELGQLQDGMGAMGKDSVISDDAFMSGDFMNEAEADSMTDDFDSTMELNILMGELDGLLDEDKGPKT